MAERLPFDAESLDQLRDLAAGCTRCHLYKDATQTVFGAGPPSADLMLVGEQPGDQEDRQGAPFVGPAGGLLDRALRDAGIDHPSAILRMPDDRRREAYGDFVADFAGAARLLQ